MEVDENGTPTKEKMVYHTHNYVYLTNYSLN
jgi:hypothetical protein